MASHWVKTYNTKFVDRLGVPRENKGVPFTEVQAESIDTALEPCGLSRASAQRLIDRWNRLSRALGTERTYSIDPE